MLADLDLLLCAVFCPADDLLPESGKNARRSVTDAEVVTLAVAQEMMGIDHDAEFLAIARTRLAHLFARLPSSPATGSADSGAATVLHRRGGRAAVAVSVGVAVGVPKRSSPDD